MMAVAIIGVVVSFSGAIEGTYMSLSLGTPDFEYEVIDGQEVGNEMFGAYQQMRLVAMGIFGAVLIFAAVSKVLESTESNIVKPGTANSMISKSLLFLLIILVFPPFWDIGTDVMLDVSQWVLNPNYSFDPDNPCPADWTDEDITRAYLASPYITTLAKVGVVDPDREQVVSEPGRRSTQNQDRGVDNQELICEPKLKVSYVFGQMLRTTEDSVSDGPTSSECRELLSSGNVTAIANSAACQPRLDNQLRGELMGPDTGVNDWLGGVSNSIQKGSESFFTNLFLGLTKALVAIQVLIMALLIGIMADMLTAMIAAALPVFLMLSLIPKVDEVANKMLQALPALLLLPLLSSIIIVVGAGTIVQAGAENTGSSGFDHIHTWITSIGVVFFAITLPTLLVPLLGTVSQMATQVVSSAVQTSTMVTGMAAASAGSAARGKMNQMGGTLAGNSKWALLKGAAPAAAAGLGQGLFAGQGKAGAPNMGGGNFMPNTQQMGTDMNNAMHAPGGLPSPSQQQQHVQNHLTDLEQKAHTPAHANKLHKLDNSIPKWDKNISDKENVANINNGIAGVPNPNEKLQNAINNFQTPTDKMAMKGGWLEQTDIENAVQNGMAGMSQNQASENMMKHELMAELAKQKGTDPDSLQSNIGGITAAMQNFGSKP